VPSEETRLSGSLYPTGDELITSPFPNGPKAPLLSCSSGSQVGGKVPMKVTGGKGSMSWIVGLRLHPRDANCANGNQ